ncbi:unnamed protein product [Protopolystoma xenopodis]|uniref:Uncharacterized protein n=1 Tax=Protopolystoma xenopodis TaxID=117903 RepID=A0A448XFA1_9PLAT|nr:unnamed protein product [Protopolystoma xenopodis]
MGRVEATLSVQFVVRTLQQHRSHHRHEAEEAGQHVEIPKVGLTKSARLSSLAYQPRLASSPARWQHRRRPIR